MAPSTASVDFGDRFQAAFDLTSRPALHTAMVSSKLLFDADGGLIGAEIGVRVGAFRFHHNARIEMELTFGAEPMPVFVDGGMTGIAAIEIFRGRLIDAHADAFAQRFADIEVFSRNAKSHQTPPLLLMS